MHTHTGAAPLLITFLLALTVRAVDVHDVAGAVLASYRLKGVEVSCTKSTLVSHNISARGQMGLKPSGYL